MVRRLLCLLGLVTAFALASAAPALAAPADPAASAAAAAAPSSDPAAAVAGAGADTANDASISIDLANDGGKPTNALLVVVLLTLLSVAPAVIILATSFTRIVVVLSLTRNALGLQGIPPNQVIVGLALFISLFVMAPTLKAVNEDAIQPLMRGDKTQAQAWEAGVGPMRRFMLKETGHSELAMFTATEKGTRPATPEKVGLASLLPAFVLSELKTAFIIGFVVFIPFLVIDIVVSSTLMSMGMMMLPPVVVSLPFKLLLFVLVDGWGLVVKSLIKSF